MLHVLDSRVRHVVIIVLFYIIIHSLSHTRNLFLDGKVMENRKIALPVYDGPAPIITCRCEAGHWLVYFCEHATNINYGRHKL